MGYTFSERVGKLLLSTGLLLAGLALSLGAVYSLATGRVTYLAAIGGAIALLLALVYWRVGFYLALVVLLLEGFFRNYFNNPAILLVKDALLGAIYLRVFGQQFLRRQRILYQTPFNLVLALFLVVNLVQIFNPNNLAFSIGLVGLRSGFMYMPLMFLIPELINSRKAQGIFNWFILVSGLAISSFGIVQYYLGYKAYQALGPGFEQSTFVTGGEFSSIQIFRPNSTFSWASHFALFLVFVTLYTIGLALQSTSRLRWVAWITLALLAYAVLIAGQRSDYVILPICVILMLVIMRRISSAFLMVLPLAIGILLILNTVASETVLDRLTTISLNKDDVIFDRLAAGWGNTLTGIVLNPFGVGTGMATLGSQYAAVKIPYFFEGYYGKIAAELGWIGLGVYIWLLVLIARHMISCFSQIKTVPDRWVVLPMLMFLMAIYYKDLISNTLDVAVGNMFFWIAIGLVLAIHRLNAQEQAVVVVVEPPPNYAAVSARRLIGAGSRR